MSTTLTVAETRSAMTEQQTLRLSANEVDYAEDVREAELVVFTDCSHGLGLKICGGCSPDGTEMFGIFVKKILPGGLAEADGNLYEGDQILTVNGESLDGVSNDMALSILRQAAASNRVEMIFTRDDQAQKRKGGCRKTAGGAAAVSAQDEEPERVEEGPQVIQEAQGTDHRQRVDDPPSGASKEKRPPLRLDLEQEGVVFEFVETHQELYSKGHPDFLKTGHKLALWQQLADTLKATDFDDSIAKGPRMMTWWNSQRSAYGKVTRNVSGQGTKRLTAREERLKERLAFLRAHVYRVPKRAGVDLMGQLREKHPERFDVPIPAVQGRPPRESDTDSEQEQTTCPPTGTQTEEPASTSRQRTPCSASRKRKRSHLLLERIEKRLAANQQQAAQIAQQEDNPQAAFGRLVGLSAAQMDDEAFEGLQVDVTALLVKYKRESRARTQAASVTQATPCPPPMPKMPPDATTHHTIADFSLSSGLAIQQNQQCPGGSAPIDFSTPLGDC